MRRASTGPWVPGALFGALISLLLAGCSETPGIGDARGNVTHGGKLVTAGVVKFFPVSGGPAVAGAISPDGTYRASGVPTGRCKVAVETLEFKHMSAPPKELAKQILVARPVYVPIPSKYEKPDSSGIEVEIKKGDNLFELAVD
ncbi:hypothetical protein [Frigoriglobus tundricola]|uniref:Carboxypeptidase regulatory-like domain-containing protein n=1 Tax=Frigoriglobus tundricola TaxID=2774151 RepID=A0A6M5Z3E7_9BACT|nr:hypothetical protein [Frigoriglobus tundricola]QJX00626.1 hypothetical protein FTUN_8258 [Frigoriglobus tundricola]